MRTDKFKARHAKAISALWNGVVERYGVTELEFANRLAMIESRSGELESSEDLDLSAHWLTHLRADELILVMACERGDEMAWRVFEMNYRSGMRAAARALTKDEAEAEDLTQSLFGELYGVRFEGERRLSKFAHYSGRGSLGGWLRAVVYQAFIDRKRQVSRLEQTEKVEDFERLAAKSERLLVAPSARPDEIEEVRLRRATEKALAEAFAALNVRDRLLLNYYYFDDLTLREIGALMGVHEATISRWLQRVQRQTRRRTEEILQSSYGLRRAEVSECLQLAARTEIDVRKLLGDVESASADRAS